MLLALLQGPLGNPFRIFHRKRTHKEILGTTHNSHLTWEKKELPGAGAGQYAWETLGQPIFPVFGRGNIHVENPLKETFPASYVFQSVGVVGIPPTGVLQGQFVTQPLMDPDTAANIGIVLPGSVSPAPNAIGNSSPVLAP